MFLSKKKCYCIQEVKGWYHMEEITHSLRLQRPFVTKYAILLYFQGGYNACFDIIH